MDMEVAAVADFEITRIEVPDQDTGGWVIEGTEIARVSSKFGAPGQNRTRPRERWSENVVWRLASGKYAVLRGSYSTVYHSDPTGCRTQGGAFSGVPIRVADLPANAEPCWICDPPYQEDLADQEKVRYEVPRQQMDICESAEDVISTLTSYRKHSGSRATGVSEPVRALIQQCREHDPDFTEVELPMQRIS
jgi:hypothetical protein